MCYDGGMENKPAFEEIKTLSSMQMWSSGAKSRLNLKTLTSHAKEKTGIA